MLTPPFEAPTRHRDADSALAAVQARYASAVQHLRAALKAYVQGELDGRQRVRATYPLVRLQTPHGQRRPEGLATRLSYGFVADAGRYETSLTRPDLFASYLRQQFELLLANHGAELEVANSNQPIPIHFALAEHDHIEGELTPQRRAWLREVFDLPDLTVMDDGIANGTHEVPPGAPQPLALFTAARVDYSLQRLRHYCGSSPRWFQHFVLLTNYGFYVDEFIRLGQSEMQRAESDYIAFVEPGNVLSRRLGRSAQASEDAGLAPPRAPQMPAYHLVREDGSGITLINIGVGPSNAKTITDHLAVLRPHAWLMLGHCAGLRNGQQLGDYVLAHAYVREDHVLDEELPLWVPIPALAEVQQALEGAVADVTGLSGSALKSVLRTGTVASTDNRNWELLPARGSASSPQRRLSQSRAVALDMESATVAANGFRFRVPYGTLLCVSDKPLHGEIKLPGMANHFYRQRVSQHLQIGIRAVQRLRELGAQRLHSRKLRSFAEVAFQ